MPVDLSTGGYATEQDLLNGGWLPDGTSVPDDVTRYLRSASFVVARAANRAIYSDDPSVVDAPPLRDATCAQAASWISLGIDPAKLGIDGPAPVKSSTILSGKVEYDTAAHAQARLEAVSELAPEAESILSAAGMLWIPVPAYADCQLIPSWGLDPQTPFGYGWPSIDGWPFL